MTDTPEPRRPGHRGSLARLQASEPGWAIPSAEDATAPPRPPRRFRTGNCWRDQTIILEGVGEPDKYGRRPDDQLVATVDSGAPPGLIDRIVDLLNMFYDTFRPVDRAKVAELINDMNQGPFLADPAPGSLPEGWPDH